MEISKCQNNQNNQNLSVSHQEEHESNIEIDGNKNSPTTGMRMVVYNFSCLDGSTFKLGELPFNTNFEDIINILSVKKNINVKLIKLIALGKELKGKNNPITEGWTTLPQIYFIKKCNPSSPPPIVYSQSSPSLSNSMTQTQIKEKMTDNELLVKILGELRHMRILMETHINNKHKILEESLKLSNASLYETARDEDIFHVSI